MSKRRQSDLGDGAEASAEKKSRSTHTSSDAAEDNIAVAGTPRSTRATSATPLNISDDKGPAATPVDPNAILPSPIQMCVHDMGPHFKVKDDNLVVVGEKGYRMIRATHGINEGAIYFEMKFLPSPALRISGKMTVPAVRIGVCTADGDIQAPVGYDIHSYAYRSVDGSKVHNAHVSEYGTEGFSQDDVVGVWLVLPPDLNLSNKDGDKTESEREKEEAARKLKKAVSKKKGGAIDRISMALAAENQLNPSSMELELEAAAAAVPLTKISEAELVQQKKFHKKSFLKFFKNGKAAAANPAFTDLLRAKYFPAISLYMGANVKLNFGPDFWCPPEQVLQGVQIQLQAAQSGILGAAANAPVTSSSVSASPAPVAVSTSADVVMTDASTSSSSPTPPVSSTPLPTMPFRHPLSKTLLTSGLFPHLEGSLTVLHPNPKQLAANAAAQEEAKQKALLAAFEQAKKQGLTVPTTATGAVDSAAASAASNLPQANPSSNRTTSKS